MTTPCSGEIRVSHISTELGQSASINRTLGQSDGRVLADVLSGQIRLSDYYCKSGFMYATGGSVTEFTDGAGVKWRVHVFNDSGVFSVLRLGNLGGYVQRLIVGGGGGGGGSSTKPTSGSGGGGGAGDYIGGGVGTVSGDIAYAILGSNAVTVGAGGAPSQNGGTSSFRGENAVGGGAGGSYGGPSLYHGRNGASGGGCGQPGPGDTANGGSPTGVRGYGGGSTTIPSNKETSGGGGGGGAGGAGANAYAGGSSSPINGGNGGPGVASVLTGGSVTRAAGGGGAGCNASSDSGTGTGEPGQGGSGNIGGRGAKHANYGASAPVQNTGSGGGGGNGSGLYFPASAGAKGVVIIRYPISPYTPPVT